VFAILLSSHQPHSFFAVISEFFVTLFCREFWSLRPLPAAIQPIRPTRDLKGMSPEIFVIG
jgi:hypothetical protein